jgi:hypothetical protein
MSKKILSALCVLIVMPLAVAFGQGGGNGNAMNPVGTWDLEYAPPGGFPPPYKVLWTLDFGGTSISTAQGFPFWSPPGPGFEPIVVLMVGLTSWGRSTSHGSWEKIDSHTYALTTYNVFPHLPTDPVPPHEVANLKGYVRAVHEFTLIDKDTLEGWCVISILDGRDPLNPDGEMSFPPQYLFGRRLGAERLPAP